METQYDGENAQFLLHGEVIFIIVCGFMVTHADSFLAG